MKRKNILISLILVLILICSISLFACSEENTNHDKCIVSIEKTQTDGLKDIYTVTYSDGSTSTMEISNGRAGSDGKDAQSPTIDDMYNKYLELHPGTSYEDFLKKVLEVNVSSNTTSINKALQSAAKVYTEFTENKKFGSIYSVKDTSIYLGSAVIYKINADYTYFITNYHVVYNRSAIEASKIAKKIVCYLYGSEGGPTSTNTKDPDGCTIYDYGKYAIKCEYVGGSITADLAIIRANTSDVKAINENVKEAEFASEYSVGDTAIAIGNPEGEGLSVTEGVVSVDNEYIKLSIDGTTRSYRSIRIDTAIYSGSSGGGLFDIDGKLIGITNAGDGTDQNVNYAIPLEIVKSAVENIMYYSALGEQNAKKITLGVEVVSSNSKYIYDSEKGRGRIVETINVNKITTGSIVEGLGLQVGDIVKSLNINGTKYLVDRMFEISDLLFMVRSGDVISITYIREETETTTADYTVLDSDLNQVS